MTTDPGDLVLDPTCGSGTTAYVAEQRGRRWITCDTSRVPLALARQRLLTATFPWYELKEPGRGPAGGFVYRRKQNKKGEEVGGLVPRITLRSIANDEEPETVTLVDRPEVNRKVTRVCGPFAVEATIQAVTSLEEAPAARATEAPALYANPRAYLDRMVEVLRRARTLRLPGNAALALDSVRPLAECEHLHAEAKTAEGQRVAVLFGPEDGAIDSQVVLEGAREAWFLKYDQLYLFGFAIEAKARGLVEDRAKLRVPCAYINVTPDVVMADLLKTSHTDQIFSLTGLPDMDLHRAGAREDGTPLYQVEVRGLDTFRPDTLATESIAAENLPCWMLDADYNGLVFCATQVFFPRTGAWDNLRRSLRAEFDPAVWDHLAGTVSEPFALGESRRIAVKVIDERGNELMAVREAE
jgi:adenine-specific DNA-methyltransferase